MGCMYDVIYTHINTQGIEKEIGVELLLVKFHFLSEKAYFSTSKKIHLKRYIHLGSSLGLSVR